MAEYLIPAGYGEEEFIEKRSRFIGRVWPVASEEEAIEHIKSMREQHWDASHNVYAYSLRKNGIARYSDDGEPSGTSGQPVLRVFQAGGVQDFCCVVTRYFGGILLGAGGLVRAYTKSASLALERAGRAEMRRMTEAMFSCTYSQAERIRAELTRAGIAPDNVDYAADVTFTLSLTEAELTTVSRRVVELTSGASELLVLGESLRPVRIE